MLWGFFFSLPPSLLFPTPQVKPHQEQHGEKRCWGFWGVGQWYKRGTLASPAPLGSSISHVFLQWGSLLSFPPALPQGIKSCPPPYPVFPARRFPKAQERVQHPDLNFNAILAPKASFCCCQRKLIRKVLLLQPCRIRVPTRLFGQVQPLPGCSPSCPSKGRELLL